MEAVELSSGWGVLHLFYKVDRERAEVDPRGGKRVVDAVQSLEADGHQALLFAVLGHKADLGVMALGPDLARLQAFQRELSTAPLVLVDSYVSFTELSEYTASEDDERARLESEEGLTGAELEASLAVWRDRIAHYREQRLHPKLPLKRSICFYPMSKRRVEGANWYSLPFDARKALMAGHARVGRTYAGRVLQLITGSTGLDDWEWGVTLLADDPVALKEIVYEMRFDPVSAVYAEFGPFVTGLLSEPADALRHASACERVGAVDHVRLFVAFPETLVDRPMIYEIVKQFDVVPNIRRANVESNSGWVILELGGSAEQRDAAVAYLQGLGCTVNAMEGDVLEG